MTNESNLPHAASRPRYVLGTTVMDQHLCGLDTHGLFSLFENVAPSKSRTPIHVHTNDDETFFMLEGEMTAVVKGEERLLRVGESIFLPRLIPHQLINKSADSARYLLLCTPSGFEGFLAAGGSLLSPGSEPAPLSEKDIERMRYAAPSFGITILNEWPTAFDSRLD